MRDASVIEIDLAAIQHNLRVLRRIVGPTCGLCPILKADAYGLGARPIAPRLEAAGADMVAVYTLDQAADLFGAALEMPVLVLMPVRELDSVHAFYRALISGRLHLTVHDGRHLDDLVGLTRRFGVAIPVHLEVDTGMSRGGCRIEEAPALLQRIATTPRLELAGIFTHFARADRDVAFTDRQMAVFDKLVAEHRALLGSQTIVHAANSIATIRHRRYHKAMVRIGMAWAGYGPEWITRGRVITEARDLRSAVRWTSQIVQVKTIEAGTPVGYGSTWTAKRRSVVATVPVGYADGYPLELTSTDARSRPASVRVLGEGGATGSGLATAFAPTIGAVNMDQITLDLTDLWHGTIEPDWSQRRGHECVGTTVELIGRDPEAANHPSNLARTLGIVTHVLLSHLSPRLRRVYRVEQEAVATVATVEGPSRVGGLAS
jgi:alanine racemase